MKKIKRIVLKDAAKLTNSEMKRIRGGFEPETEYLTSCTVYCNLHTGAYYPEIEGHCDAENGYYCVVEEGVRVYCQNKNTGDISYNYYYNCQYGDNGIEDFKLE